MIGLSRVKASIIVMAISLTLTGCSQRGPELGFVTGKVTFKGQTLPTGTIVFVPETSGMPMSFAEIQPDGTYEASTKKFGKGVAVGHHKIMINAIKVIPGKENDPVNCCQVLLPAKYNSEQKSGLTADVVSGDNVIDFNL